MNRKYLLVTNTWHGVWPAAWENQTTPRLFDSHLDAQICKWQFLQQYNQDVREDREYAVSLIPEDVQGLERLREIREICEDYAYITNSPEWIMEVRVMPNGDIVGDWFGDDGREEIRWRPSDFQD